ncbi:enoyl-CoA hydratase/isomerase family protein [Pseudorhodoferax soli]|uniref:2-(1,2-epoxy-1,2-dihydrophenyl)acetyl-CoA isomerase n=1 Tax=Pseudorhodoferax soli TaxID=545864 RepID=A0A368XQI5_9BURK|nr:enoyl-CoA hydratase-related protein [Pseudorhodoferax soli]RCW69416.1 2-(1,2-epoxy-1,2-dihydrophenyl)acetyl-CoA isomerase [Pseudorhodoferax soli]
MPAEALVQWHIEDGVGHIVLNRPAAANALNSAAGRALADAIDQASRADIGAVLLSSTGRQFCAGGDIGEFVERQADLDRLVRAMLDPLHPAIHTLATLPVPVVSAVHGPVGGAGIALALCADIVLAAPAMKLRGGYSAIGLSPDLGASYYLARRAGAARAKLILMTNRAIAAEECLRWGLVDELHEAEALPGAARALALQLARGATGSLGGIKRLCDGALQHGLRTHLQLEREALLRCAVSADGREGINAFMAKRPPVFNDPRLPTAGDAQSTHQETP